MRDLTFLDGRDISIVPVFRALPAHAAHDSRWWALANSALEPSRTAPARAVPRALAFTGLSLAWGASMDERAFVSLPPPLPLPLMMSPEREAHRSWSSLPTEHASVFHRILSFVGFRGLSGERSVASACSAGRVSRTWWLAYVDAVRNEHAAVMPGRWTYLDSALARARTVAVVDVSSTLGLLRSLGASARPRRVVALSSLLWLLDNAAPLALSDDAGARVGRTAELSDANTRTRSAAVRLNISLEKLQAAVMAARDVDGSAPWVIDVGIAGVDGLVNDCATVAWTFASNNAPSAAVRDAHASPTTPSLRAAVAVAGAAAARLLICCFVALADCHARDLAHAYFFCDAPAADAIADATRFGVGIDVDFVKLVAGSSATVLGSMQGRTPLSVLTTARPRSSSVASLRQATLEAWARPVSSTQETSELCVIGDGDVALPAAGLARTAACSGCTPSGPIVMPTRADVTAAEQLLLSLSGVDEPSLKVSWLEAAFIRAAVRANAPHTGTGRVHARAFAETVTGRVSLVSPPLQSFPPSVRAAVVAGPGMSFVAGDFRALEVRLLAHFSADTALCAAIADGADDVFSSLAAAWGGGIARDAVKRIVYGIIYGRSAGSIAETLGGRSRHELGADEAAHLVESFHLRFPGVRRFLGRALWRARNAGGVVRSVARRARALPDLMSTDTKLRATAERKAINTICQASAADVFKRALARVYARCLETSSLDGGGSGDGGGVTARHVVSGLAACTPPHTRIVLHIHDEIIVETPTALVTATARWLREEMMAAFADFELTVPAAVRISAGRTWAALEEL